MESYVLVLMVQFALTGSGMATVEGFRSADDCERAATVYTAKMAEEFVSHVYCIPGPTSERKE